MSNELLRLGASGMISLSQGMTTIGNNISNSATAGYKSGRTSFSEAFYIQSGGQANGLMNQKGQGAVVAGTTYDWNSGAIKDTGVMTHVAVVGDGFIPVSYRGDTYYSRAGDFSLVENPATAGEYVLMRPNGSTLMHSDGSGGVQELAFPNPPDSIQINSDGTVSYSYTSGGASVTDTIADPIVLQQVTNADSLSHVEGGLYRTTSNTTLGTIGQPGTGGFGSMRQGALEESNVDLVKEFTEMIAAQRAFQANSRSVTTADSMLQEVIQLKR